MVYVVYNSHLSLAGIQRANVVVVVAVYISIDTTIANVDDIVYVLDVVVQTC